MNTKQLQAALIARGYDVGRAGADGILGRDTQTAVAKFQKDMGLAVKWPGTVGPTTIAALQDKPLPPVVSQGFVAVWVEEARRFLGLHEVKNAKTLDKALRLDASAIPWCGAFCAMVFATVLPGEPMPANPLGARNWLKFGRTLDAPQVGAVAVFERPGSSWSGHVGIVVGHDKTHLHVLGGNQSDSVTIARIAKSRLLGLRWPKTAGEPPEGVLAMTTISATVTSNEA